MPKILKNSLIFSILFLQIFLIKTSAQDTLSLEKAISTVLEKNYDILISRNNVQIANNNNSLGNAGMLPQITAEAGDNINYYNTHQAYTAGGVRDIDAARTEALTARLMVNWTVFDGLSMFISKKKLAELEELGKIESQQVVLNTVFQTISVYYNLVQQQKILHSISNALNLSNERVHLANTKLQIGSGSEISLLQAQLDRNADSSEWISQNILIKNTRTELNKLMIREDSSDFIVSEAIPIDEHLNYDSLFSKVMAQNPDLLSAQMNLNIAAMNLKYAKTAFLPKISIFAGYNYSNTNSQAGLFSENKQTGPLYGATATFTIFNGFNNYRNNRNVKIQYLSGEAKLNQSKLEVKIEFQKLYNEYISQLNLVKLETENAEAARKSTELSFSIYKQGMMSDIDFRAAQQKQLDADIRLLSAQYTAKLKETQLLSFSGELLK